MIETVYIKTNDQVSHAVKVQVPDNKEMPHEEVVKAAKVVLMRTMLSEVKNEQNTERNNL